MSALSADPDAAYYVYALTRRLATTRDLTLEDVFYVGKGKGRRWSTHFHEALREVDEDPAAPSGKLDTIRGLDLDNHKPADYTLIISGGLDEAEAFRVEALVIEMLRRVGVPLTNRVRGHHSEIFFKPVTEVEHYYTAKPAVVERIRVACLADFLPGGPRAGERLCVCVKGSALDLDRFTPRRVRNREPRIPGFTPARTGKRVAAGTAGWDPNVPWSTDEARERACQYWSMAVDTARHLKAIGDDGRLDLRLLIQDPRAGQSVFRYSWPILPGEPWWEYPKVPGYPSKVGFPLGDARTPEQDPWLGHYPIRADDERQLLAGYQGGMAFAALPAVPAEC